MPDPIEARLHDPQPRQRQAAAIEAGRSRAGHLLPMLEQLARCDDAQLVRREAASAIGRLARTHPQALGLLVELSQHRDPGVVIQAARGLVAAARSDEQRAIVEPMLDDLAQHANEVVRDFVETERARFENSHTRPRRGGGGGGKPSWLRNVVVHGDALESLRQVPDDSVHLTFTSPPYYNARDYSTYQSYDEYLDFLTEIFTEVHRITDDGRFLVVNTSPVIVPRAGRQHESHRYAIPFDLHPRLTGSGWRFIDDIIWKKPDGAAKPRNSGFNVHRQPMTYKANAVTEYVMVYRKQSHRLIDWNLRQYSKDQRDASRVPDGYEPTNVWELDPAHDRVHSAVFPTSLCERVVEYYSMIGDLVLDPFAGSGTLGVAAQRLNRDFLMIEQSEQYVQRMQQRLGRVMQSQARMQLDDKHGHD